MSKMTGLYWEEKPVDKPQPSGGIIMTDHDVFAAVALTRIYKDTGHYAAFAKMAYDQADAMVAEQARRRAKQASNREEDHDYKG